MNVYQENLLKAFQIMLEEFKRKLNRDYTIIGKIVSYDETNNIYTVLYNGAEIKVKAIEGLALQPDDIVYIKVVQGNFNEKFIYAKKPL